MCIWISPLVKIIDQFKLRPDRKVEISEITEIVINLQLQLILIYKFSKNRMLGKGTETYEARGKTKT